MQVENIFAALPENLDFEVFETLQETESFRVERIVSQGQFTEPDKWYDQDEDEWVLVLQGRAGLQLEGKADEVLLSPGDYMFLPAHLRHRVTWTAAEELTIWLAIHSKVRK